VERRFCRGSTYRAGGDAQTGDQKEERVEHIASFAGNGRSPKVETSLVVHNAFAL
jgi:hypothetical protein